MSPTLSFFNRFKKITVDSVPFASEQKNAPDSSRTPPLNQENPHLEATDDDKVKKNNNAKFRFKQTPLFGNKRKVKDQSKQVLSEQPKLEISNAKVNGNVFNIVNGTVQFGNSIVINGNAKSEKKAEDIPGKSEISLNQDIKMLIGAQEEPKHIFIDIVAKNMGKNWRTFFRNLGLSQGKIETKEEEFGRNGISEVRYQLLLEWVRNSDDVSLGKLTSRLWEHGERELCSELARTYKEERMV